MVIGDGALTPALSGRNPTYILKTLITSIRMTLLAYYCRQSLNIAAN